MSIIDIGALIAGFLAVPILLGVARAFGAFVIVRERQCIVFELFGTVRLVLDNPGLHFPWLRLGPAAALLPLFGRRHVVELGSTRPTCAARRSTPKRALRWASASGTRW
ncbi:hypothetical protein [Dactylosporangium darangshiense]|uniref:hypothetical protein n=1 Tax=Dactylosporangium darangshiense TaxID=579108 RepID=UPI0036453647